MNRIIKIKINENATLDEFKYPPLTEGNKNGILTDIEIPAAFLYEPVFSPDGIDLANTVAVGAVVTTKDGKSVALTPCYADFVKDFQKQGTEYALWGIPEIRFPEEWTKWAGSVTLTVNVTNLSKTTDGQGVETWVEDQIAVVRQFTMPIYEGKRLSGTPATPVDPGKILEGKIAALQRDMEAVAGYKGKVGTIYQTPTPINLSELQDRKADKMDDFVTPVNAGNKGVTEADIQADKDRITALETHDADQDLTLADHEARISTNETTSQT
jgi:hypothetical protein